MTSRIERLLIALMFALLAAGVTLVIASAQGEEPPAPQAWVQDCAACHKESKLNWDNGAHAKSEVVTCEACHGATPTDHPTTSMPVDRSPDLCISCHVNANFGAKDWKASKHYQLGIDCATCHDPHSTSLKMAARSEGATTDSADSSALCINCHKESSMNFPYSTHNQQGVTCLDCHQNPVENADGTPGTATNHTFQASIKSCNTCHADQMHSPTEAQAPEATHGSVSVGPAVEGPVGAVTPEPEPISPMGFSAMAGVVGLAGGMVLAPWLERWYRRLVKSNREEENE
jgi:predicted CXXCH cytochrome family protein